MSIEAHKCNVKGCKGFIVFDNADFDYQHPPTVNGMYEFDHPTCTECGKEYKVVPHHVVIHVDESGEFEPVESACITAWEKREKERKFEQEMNPYDKIWEFIELRDYTYSVEDIIEGYAQQQKGYYVSHTMKDCLHSLKLELERLA